MYDALLDIGDDPVWKTNWLDNLFNKSEELKLIESSMSNVVQAFVVDAVMKMTAEKIHDELKFARIKANLISILSTKLEYSKEGLTIANDDETVKTVNSPGQLGLVMFQLLNDAIEMEEIEAKNRKGELDDRGEKMGKYDTGADFFAKLSPNFIDRLKPPA